MQGVIGCYLEQCLKLFTTQQREVRERAKSVTGADPQDAVAAVTQRNYQRWRSVQDEIFRTLMGPSARVRAEEEEKPAGAPTG
jgi:polyhydroxyalkanoate synthesis regulator protein